jgi:predicted RNA-binding Zn-ribbon protein involved in translation (DUF1610 family)
MKCPTCGATVTTGRIYCTNCVQTFGTNLANIGIYYEDVYAIAAKQATLSIHSGGHTTKAHAPLLMNSDGYDYCNQLADNVNNILSTLNYGQHVQAGDTEKVSNLYLQLSLCAEHVTHSLKATELMHETAVLAKRLHVMLTRETELKYVGNCATCGGSVYASDDDTYINCPECGQYLNLNIMRVMQMQQLETSNLNLQPQDAANLLEYKGVHVRANTIRKWAERGKLTAMGTDSKGHKLYPLQQIIELAARK